MGCYRFSIVKITYESVTLIQVSKKNRKYCDHNGKQSTFYQKVLHIKTNRLRKIERLCNIRLAINANYLTKTVLKAKSDSKFNMQEVILDESELKR